MSLPERPSVPRSKPTLRLLPSLQQEQEAAEAEANGEHPPRVH
jgi:hypothetical protein